jgi:hypothetical protein
MVNPWYASREDVKSSLDFKETARNNALVDRALKAATGTVESTLKRVFYPTQTTRYKDWPNSQHTAPWIVRLDRDELISLDILVAGGVTIAPSDYFLEPVNSGPPYTRIEINLASSASLSSGDTWQRAIAMTGLFGYRNDEVPAGALDGAIGSTSATSIAVTDSSLVGVGNLIRVDNERLVVTGKAMRDTTQNLQVSLTANKNNETVVVSDGTKFHVGEVILIDSERMLIDDLAGNSLTVKRAWDGTTLAAHTAPTADIYAPRLLTVVRAALGTTAATHSDATAVVKHTPPGLVQELCVAEAVVYLKYGAAGWASTVTQQDSKREKVPVRGIEQIRTEAIAAHGRKMRHRAV